MENSEKRKKRDGGIRPEVVEELFKTKRWSRETAEAGERADYFCEYCGMDLLEDIESYKLWQVDHIVPICIGGAKDGLENKAIACKTCNWDWKGNWDPSEGKAGLSRDDLIGEVKKYVAKRQIWTKQQLEEDRTIILGEKTPASVK